VVPSPGFFFFLLPFFPIPVGQRENVNAAFWSPARIWMNLLLLLHNEFVVGVSFSPFLYSPKQWSFDDAFVSLLCFFGLLQRPLFPCTLPPPDWCLRSSSPIGELREESDCSLTVPPPPLSLSPALAFYDLSRFSVPFSPEMAMFNSPMSFICFLWDPLFFISCPPPFLIPPGFNVLAKSFWDFFPTEGRFVAPCTPLKLVWLFSFFPSFWFPPCVRVELTPQPFSASLY